MLVTNIIITIYVLSLLTVIILAYREDPALLSEALFFSLIPGLNTLILILIVKFKISDHLEDKKINKLKIQEQRSTGIFEVIIDGKSYKINDKEF